MDGVMAVYHLRLSQVAREIQRDDRRSDEGCGPNDRIMGAEHLKLEPAQNEGD
jgi:hypothetical protein